jgi:hypothetical protein
MTLPRQECRGDAAGKIATGQRVRERALEIGLTTVTGDWAPRQNAVCCPDATVAATSCWNRKAHVICEGVKFG